MAMNTLNYEMPLAKPRAGSGKLAFWLIFAGALLPGLILGNICDELFEKSYLGHHASGEMMPILALGIPVSGIVALITRAIRGKDRTGWRYALALGLLGPTFALIAIIVIF
jgi:hypothetical protein